jgi:DNA (cytosine-5)-methyltransferase 1
VRSLDLFSGVGGFALGFELAGIETAAFCEQDLFCREWLAQRWPNVPCHPDIRWLDGRTIGPVDVVCGGFPCQDISTAGRGEGLDGARSGLWFQMHRIVCEVRPLWVVIENVPRLRTLGADRIYSDMEQAGYTGWFHVVGADDVGAPHRRKRVWGIFRRLADTDGDTLRLIEQRLSGGRQGSVRDGGQAQPRGDGARVGDADGEPGERRQHEPLGGPQGRTTADGAR